MFLSAKEVADLTGFARRVDQIQWLRLRRWSFDVSGTGRPVIMRTYAESRDCVPVGVGKAHVYIVGAIGQEMPVKIGTSTFVKSRLETLQSGSPLLLELRGCYEVEIDAAYNLEHRCHGQFRKQRSHGEWFTVLSADVAAWIEATFPEAKRIEGMPVPAPRPRMAREPREIHAHLPADWNRNRKP